MAEVLVERIYYAGAAENFQDVPTLRHLRLTPARM
jgi:hypothetical protein